MASNQPQLWLGGSSAATGGLGTIQDSYTQLVSSANILEQSGAGVFRMWSGLIGQASERLVIAGQITEQVRQENMQLLQAIGQYCVQHGIAIAVEDNLTWTPLWTADWIATAKQAGLPIKFVDDAEVLIGVPDTPDALGALARTVATDAKIIAAAYPSVQIGDLQPSSHPSTAGWTAELRHWWAAYNAAAAATGAPVFSYYLADVAWDGPGTAWRADLEAASAAAAAAGLGFGVFVNGYNDATSSPQWIAQAKQNLALMAADSAINPTFLVAESWSGGFPDAVTPINDPGTMGNLGLSISQLYGAYHAAGITASGAVTLRTRPQAVYAGPAAASLGGMSVTIAGTGRAAVLLVDQTGRLSATAASGGSVSGAGTNALLLQGDAAALNAELATLTVSGAANGPDTLEIEVFNAQGMSGRSQVQLLNLPTLARNTAFNVVSSGTTATWKSASGFVAANGIMTSLTFNWFAPSASADPTPPPFNPITTATVTSPLAGQGLQIVAGKLLNPAAQNVPLFNPTDDSPNAEFQSVRLVDTTRRFDPVTGVLQQEISHIAPTGPGAVATDPLAQGGTLTKTWNLPGNPVWNPGWNNLATTLTDVTSATGVLIERVIDWQSGLPELQTSFVFSPTGAQWQQIKAMGGSAGHVTGDKVITFYNTGDNPDWDLPDWKNDSRVTTTFRDGLAIDQVSVNADGTSMHEQWCYDGSQPWFCKFEYFDVKGRETSDSFQWKDGNPLRSTTHVFDPASGSLYQVWDCPVRGGYTLTQFDITRTAPVASFVQTVDAGNNMVELDQIMKPGGAVSRVNAYFDPANRAAHEVDTFNASGTVVQILGTTGALVFQDTLPLNAQIDIVHQPKMHFIYAAGATQTVTGSGDADYFILSALKTAQNTLSTIAKFDLAADIVALPTSRFGTWDRIAGALQTVAGGTALRSTSGNDTVFFQGIAPSQLSHHNISLI